MRKLRWLCLCDKPTGGRELINPQAGWPHTSAEQCCHSLKLRGFHSPDCSPGCFLYRHDTLQMWKCKIWIYAWTNERLIPGHSHFKHLTTNISQISLGKNADNFSLFWKVCSGFVSLLPQCCNVSVSLFAFLFLCCNYCLSLHVLRCLTLKSGLLSSRSVYLLHDYTPSLFLSSFKRSLKRYERSSSKPPLLEVVFPPSPFFSSSSLCLYFIFQYFKNL